ncbi:ATP-binding protein [Mycoplasmatota bacterium]|nr:ATP-binding protein [Mycoplasmatota bacterium]
MMKKVTFLTGYYGSGKTEVAINLAIQKKIDTIVDLDVINPYFRTREMEAVLKENDIETISSEMESKMHLDMPYISKKIYNPLYNEKTKVIYDLGGNDQGAKLMRQFDDYKDIDYDLLVVVNVFRPETDHEDEIMKLINRIEGMSGFKVTGLINNSNLLKDTSLEDIMQGQRIVEKVSKKMNLPIHYTSYWNEINDTGFNVSNEILKLKLYFRKNWF